jgi:hypothetical protein
MSRRKAIDKASDWESKQIDKDVDKLIAKVKELMEKMT